MTGEYLSDQEVAYLEDHDPHGLAEYVAALRSQAACYVARVWRARARREQLPPEGDWDIAYFRGGRGSGKGWACSHIFAELIDRDPARESEGPGQWACVAPTFGDARDKCIESPESGLLKALGTTTQEIEAGTSATVAKWNRSIGELTLKSGDVVYIDGADDGGTRIQGFNLRGVWADEVGLWKNWAKAWDESIAFALRKGEAKIVASGTPKADMPARQLVERLLKDPSVVNRQLLTADNAANLANYDRLQAAYGGTTLGRQELRGELLEDVEGALWTRSRIDDWRVDAGPSEVNVRRTVIGLDPSDGVDQGDEQGLTVVQRGSDGEFYVLRSEGVRKTPLEWLSDALRTAREHRAHLVVEKNHGGAFVKGMLEQAMKETGIRAPYRVVDARSGKRTRAEPVAMLYEQGKVHHVGEHAALEEQMVFWTGKPGEKSPDLIDSLVWAMTDLMGYGGSEGEATVVRYADPSTLHGPSRGSNGSVASWDLNYPEARTNADALSRWVLGR